MNAIFERRFAALLVVVTAVGCATATVGEDPAVIDHNAATGGTTATSGGSDSSSAGSSVASGATTNSGGAGARANFGGAGRVAGGGQTSSAGRASMTGIAGCENPRDPANPGATQGDSGSFDTTEAVCFFVVGSFNAWNCSNIGGRAVTINGSPAMCGGSLPAPLDGGYYFEFSASTNGTNYTSFYWYTS